MATSGQRASAPDESAIPDGQLINSCLQGSHEAWCALIDRYRNLIFSIPVKQGFTRDDAAEVFQEVCVKLLEHLPRLREPRTLAAWLITVTVRECSRWRRQRERYHALEAGDAQLRCPAESEVTAGMLDSLRREQALREAIAEVGPRCRVVIHFLFSTSPAVSYRQLSRHLGVAEGSIGFIRMRCLKRLRQLLEAKGFS